MKKSALLLLAFLPVSLFAQVFYTETFDGTTCAAGSGCDPSIVSWTTTNVGTNGGAANKFYVSCTENGNAAGQCGSGCGSDQSLHVGNVSTSSAAFLFCPSGDCGAAYDDSSPGEITDKRCESPTINCTGQSTITISFVYMEAGQGTQDDATLWYFDGATWTSLNALAKTATGCSPQGTWTAFSAALPASANNNPNVKIGFRWVNNGDGTATDPSFAVDDITLSASSTTPPVASFTVTDQTICAGDCVNFTNTSTGGPFSVTSWTFTGASTASSTLDSPTNICYPTAGTYQVSLTVTDANGTDTETQAGYITVTSCSTPPVASFTASSTTVCAGDAVTFTDNSTNNPTSWSWTFAGGTPSSSTSQNPSITYSAPGTYSVSLTATNSAGSDTETQTAYITVINCPAPTASFNLSSTSICAGECITITNNSTNGTSFAWTFTGGNPSSSTQQNPGTVCFASAGTYSVQLIVTNASGVDTVSTNVTVSNAPSVVADGDTTVNLGNSVPISAVGSGSGNYLWTPSTGVVCSTCASTTVNPQSTGYYTINYSEGGCTVSDSVYIVVNIIEGIGVPSAFSPNGDSNNDELFVYGQGIFSMTLKIYNRYGQLVFETSDQSLGWDGKHNGKDVNSGVFVYTLDYVLSSGEISTLKGNITLVR